VGFNILDVAKIMWINYYARTDVNVRATNTKPTESRLVRFSGLSKNSMGIYPHAGIEYKILQ
jgi:hypothetical protein